MPIYSNSLLFGKMPTTMGIRIPNVPHAVPVEKDNAAAIRKMTAGRNTAKCPAAAPTFVEIKTSALSNAVIFFNAVARVRIRIAGTMAMKPLGIQSIAALNVITFLLQR